MVPVIVAELGPELAAIAITGLIKGGGLLYKVVKAKSTKSSKKKSKS